MRSFFARPGLVVFAPLLLATGCGAGAGDAGGTVVDSAGVAVVTTSSDAGNLPRWQVGESLLTVGTEDTPLVRVVGAARTPDGGVAVGTADTHEILWFDARGALTARAGGEGGGPEEYQWLQTVIGLPGDTVAAFDLMSGRANLHGSDGSILRTYSIEAPSRGFGRQPPFARLDDGTFVVRTEHTDDPYPGHQAYTVHLVRRADGQTLDTLASVPGREGYTVACGPDDSAVCTVGIAYGPATSVAARGSRVAVSGRGDEIRVLDDGVLTRILRLGEPAVAVGPDEVQAYVDSLAASAEAAGFDPARVRLLRERQSGAPSGTRMPRFVDLAIDGAGRIWAARGDVAGPRWDVFSAEGFRVATVALPPRSRIHQIDDDRILISRTDALDVETVELRPIIR